MKKLFFLIQQQNERENKKKTIFSRVRNHIDFEDSGTNRHPPALLLHFKI